MGFPQPRGAVQSASFAALPAISKLHQLTQEVVKKRPFEGDVDDFLYWLDTSWHLRGARMERSLRREEHPVVCPSSTLSLEIDLSYKGLVLQP